MGMFSVPLVVRPLNQVGLPNDGNSETVMATVDTGALYSMLPDALLRALGVEPFETLTFEVSVGETVEYPTGFAILETQGHFGAGRVVFGPEGRYRLGKLSLQDMRLLVDADGNRLVPLEPLWL